MAKKISQIEVGGETYDINGGGGGSGDALKQVSNMATYTPTDGEIVQYIGATTADYVHAGIYEYGVNMKTFAVGANKSGIPQGIYRTKASPTATNLFVSSFNGSDGNTYHSAYYPKLRVGDVMWNISTAESFYITAVNSETSYELENGVTATFSGSTRGGSIQVYEIDGYYFFDCSDATIFTRAGYDERSGFLIYGDVGEEFNNFTSTVFSGWFQLNQIGEGDVTVKKHGATVQTFNVNQQGNTNVELPNDVEMVHFNSGKAFYEAVTVCTEQNGLIYDPQELIDNPSDPRPLFPESDVYYYATNTDKVYAGETGDSDFVDVTDTVLISGNTNVLYVDVDTNQSFRYNGTAFVKITDSSKADDVPTFTEAVTRANLAGSGESTLTLWGKIKKWFSDLKAVAFSGSYNDLDNKPLSVESNKVKYTLSDGITKLTLAQEKDVVYRESYDYEFYKPDTYFGVGIADITDIITAASSDTGFEYRGFNGTVVFVRERGYIYDLTAMITCSISYKNTEIRLHTSNSSIRPQIRSSNNRYYLCIRSGANSAGTFYFYGYGKNLLSNFFAFSDNDYTLIQDCINIVNESVIRFPTNAVSGNIASGETLSVMMKKISQYFTYAEITLTPTTSETWENGFKRMLVELATLFPNLPVTTSFRITFTFYNKVIVTGGAYNTSDYANVNGHYRLCNFTALRLLGEANKIYQFGWSGTNWYYREI